MLGDTVGEVRGQAISTRILSDEGQGPRMEITDQSAGELYGVSINQTVTYVGVLRPNGTISGEGIQVDYTGTSGQSRYGINVPMAYTTAYTVFGLGCARFWRRLPSHNVKTCAF